MKKLILLILISISIISCEPNGHINAPLIVKDIKINTNSTHLFKYEIIFKDICGNDDMEYYTDKYYNINDTLK